MRVSRNSITEQHFVRARVCVSSTGTIAGTGSLNAQALPTSVPLLANLCLAYSQEWQDPNPGSANRDSLFKIKDFAMSY